jgi:hypothetical protein
VAETIEPSHRFEKVQKRASNVLKLSLEHKKLEEELRAMNERLKAAEQAMSSKRGSTLCSPSSVRAELTDVTVPRRFRIEHDECMAHTALIYSFSPVVVVWWMDFVYTFLLTLIVV